jgi:hypothetical protein
MLLATSIHSIAPNGELDVEVAGVLAKLAETYPIGVLSSRNKPDWFDEVFDGSAVQFATWPGRGGGQCLSAIAKEHDIPPHKVMVLAGCRDDIAMAKNGGAVVIGAGWVDDSYIAETGLKLDRPNELPKLIGLVDKWSGEYWYKATGDAYTVEAICDLSTIYRAEAQKRFGLAIRDAVKVGGPRLNSLLAIASCLLISGGIGEMKDLMWGVYPSSQRSNDDNEVLSDFGHRLRTTVSQVRMAKKGQPLFIRHKATVKRSGAPEVDRTNPASEVESIHLNPQYRKSIAGRNMIIIDDCTTYGISMATAAGFLRRARARSVTCLSVGKFGDRLAYYEIDVNADPFSPVGPAKWSSTKANWKSEQHIEGAQVALRELLGIA